VALLMVSAASNAACAAQDVTPDTSTHSMGSDTTSGGAGASQTKVLQGGVNHAEELPGLDDALQVGQVYSDDLLLKGSTQGNNDWFYIPPWYGGVRHAEDAMIIYRYDYQTGSSSSPMQRQLNRQNSRSGYQRDRNGGIWDYKHVPTIQHVESDLCNAVLYLKRVTPISGSDDRIVIKYDEVSISLDKRSNKILDVVQQEQINTTTSPMPGVLRIDVSVKCFGWDGKPKRQEQSVMMANIVKPFEQIDQFEGKDLRPLFRDYLMSHHLENLVPLDLEKKAQ
jgi:hypothetical protein